MNLYKEGDRTHYNQELVHCTLQRCWTQCLKDADYQRRLKEVEAFNRQHRYRKRGLAIVPTKFGIAFTSLFLNQAGALVLVYADGSVLLSHGGTEMGQGLHTKMIQVGTPVQFKFSHLQNKNLVNKIEYLTTQALSTRF